MRYPYSSEETEFCRISWDTLVLLLCLPCLVSVLVYYCHCDRMGLAGPRMFISPWSSFLSFLVSTVPVKHRQVGSDGWRARGHDTALGETVPSVSHGPFMTAQVSGGKHPPSSLAGPAEFHLPHSLRLGVFMGPHLLRFLGFRLLSSSLASLNLHSEQGRVLMSRTARDSRGARPDGSITHLGG